MINFFKTLGVKQSATVEEIHQAYLEQKRKLLYKGNSGKLELKYSELKPYTDALYVLQDDKKRRQHLEDLKHLGLESKEKRPENSPQTNNDHVEVVTRLFNHGHFHDAITWVERHPLTVDVSITIVKLCEQCTTKTPSSERALVSLVTLIHDKCAKLAMASEANDALYRSIADLYARIVNFYEERELGEAVATTHEEMIKVLHKIKNKTDEDLRTLADFYYVHELYEESFAFFNKIEAKIDSDNQCITVILARRKLSLALFLTKDKPTPASCAAVKKIIDSVNINDDISRDIVVNEIYTYFINNLQMAKAWVETLEFYERAIVTLHSIPDKTPKDLGTLHFLCSQLLNNFCKAAGLFNNDQKDTTENKNGLRRRVVAILQNNYVANLIPDRATYDHAAVAYVMLLSGVLELLKNVTSKTDDDYRNILSIYYKRMTIELLHRNNQGSLEEAVTIFNCIRVKNDTDYHILAEVRSLQAKASAKEQKEKIAAVSITFLSPSQINTDAQHSAEQDVVANTAMDTSLNDAVSVLVNLPKKT